MAQPAAIFFDLDETLIKNGPGISHHFPRLLAQYLPDADPRQFELFLETFRRYAADVWQDLHARKESGSKQIVTAIERAIAEVGGDPGSGKEIFSDWVTAVARDSELNPRVMETLAQLSARGVLLGIISNGITGVQMAKIRHHQLDTCFDAIVISEQAGAHKPEADIFLSALAQLGVSAEQAWHVGDHVENDVMGAKAVGMTAIHYRKDKDHAVVEKAFEALKLRPDYTISDMAELLGLLHS